MSPKRTTEHPTEITQRMPTIAGDGDLKRQIPHLVIVYGNDFGRRHRLLPGQNEFIVGRAPECDISIDDTRASRRHALISRDGVGFRVSDMGSLNGIRVNRERVEAGPLKDGDFLFVGKTVLKLEFATAIDERFHDEMYVRSVTDGLTGLLNRSAGLRGLEQEVSRARRQKRRLSAVMLDIDHFKRVNDTYGHPAGDMVLRDVGRLCLMYKRAEDLAVRYGGEEILIALPETDALGARRFCEHLRSHIAESEFFHDEAPIRVTASFGLAEFEPGMAGAAELVEAADRMLYRAKAAGRDRVEG